MSLAAKLATRLQLISGVEKWLDIGWMPEGVMLGDRRCERSFPFSPARGKVVLFYSPVSVGNCVTAHPAVHFP